MVMASKPKPQPKPPKKHSSKNKQPASRNLLHFIQTHDHPPSVARFRRRQRTPSHQALSAEDAVHMATMSYARVSSPSNKNAITKTNSTVASCNNSEKKEKKIMTTVPTEKEIIHARNQITVKWLWLVTAIARKLYHSYTQSFPEMKSALSHSDLVQEGVMGLIQAVEKFDSSKGYPFDSFAFYTVKHSVIRAVQNQSRPIRLPIHVLDKLAKMRKIKQLLTLHNRPINVDIIAKYAGVSQKAAQLYLQRNNSTFSIDAPVTPSTPSAATPSMSSSHANSTVHQNNGNNNNGKGRRSGGGGNSLRDFLVDHSVDVARQVERSCTREAVADLVNSTDLLELERSVLFLKFGLGDGVERVRAEVSRILDVRVHNVRRAELSALKKLRESIGNDSSTWTDLIS